MLDQSTIAKALAATLATARTMKRPQTKALEKPRPEPQPRLTVRSRPHEEARPAAQLTPLARTLKQRPAKRPSPIDAFVLARRKWVRGERLDIGQIANELGVGRATVFRWVGTREQLYGEILSAAYAYTRARLRRVAVGKGADLVADMTRRTLTTLFAAEPLRRFIAQDPEFAIRILTSKSSPVQDRCIELEAALLRELADKGEINPALEVDTLAYVIVRVSESFLYSDVISGREPNFEAASAAVRILCAAEGPPRPQPSAKKKR
jgi:AcrR family transcriptional regulator